jgi:CheY-like chemotaxis protein
VENDGARDGKSSEIRAEALEALMHETTNALTVMLGWLERAKAGESTALAKTNRHAEALRDMLRRQLVGNRGAVPLQSAETVARQLNEDMAWLCEQKSLQLVLEVKKDATIDQAHTVWRILTNLLLNAITMTPAGGTITLRCEASPDGWIQFGVEDTGPGVNPSLQSQLFRSGKSERPGGTGLGLFHSKKEADRCGGTLAYRDGKVGALFTLCWPIHKTRKAHGPESTPKGPAATSLQNMRVLLLEDDQAVVELLELSLSARGAHVVSVRTCEGLWAALQSQEFDVLLVDLSPLGLPAGKQLGRVVDYTRNKNPSIAIVTISGSISVQPRSDVMWLRKPFSPGELSKTMLAARQRHASPPASPKPQAEALKGADTKPT